LVIRYEKKNLGNRTEVKRGGEEGRLGWRGITKVGIPEENCFSATHTLGKTCERGGEPALE